MEVAGRVIWGGWPCGTEVGQGGWLCDWHGGRAGQARGQVFWYGPVGRNICTAQKCGNIWAFAKKYRIAKLEKTGGYSEKNWGVMLENAAGYIYIYIYIYIYNVMTLILFVLGRVYLRWSSCTVITLLFLVHHNIFLSRS